MSYRYLLERSFDSSNIFKRSRLAFLMLNPSTATEEANDPTVERCERRARNGGYDGVIVINLFAYRATDPKNMMAVSDPVGPENDDYIRFVLDRAKSGHVEIVCAWGVHGAYMSRDKDVLEMFKAAKVSPAALGTSKNGHPRHPLYISYSATVIPLFPEKSS